MKLAIFLSVALVIAVATILIGLALVGAPNWHFTILDVAVDLGIAIVFGILAQVLSNYLAQNRARIQPAIAVLSIVVGILVALTVEGGAAIVRILGA